MTEPDLSGWRQRLAFWAWPILAAAYLLPGHYPPWPALEQEAVAFLAFAVLVAAHLAGAKVRALAWEAVALLLCGTLVALRSLGVDFQGFRADALLSSLYLWMCLAAIQVGRGAVGIRTGDDALLPLALVWICASGISLALQFAQWLGGDTLWIMAVPSPSRPYANLGQANHVATVHVLGLGGLLYWWWVRRLSWVLVVAAVGASLSGLAMTMSRTGLLQIIVIALMMGWGSRRLGLPVRRRWILLGLIAGIGLMAAWVELNRAMLQLTETGLQERAEAGPRWVIWQSLLAGIQMKPWIGWGWGGISWAQYEVAASGIPAGRMVEYAHNIIMDLALWGGVPLALASVAAAGWWLVRVAGRANGGATGLP